MPLILLTGCAAATPDQLFMWKNVNIQGMGHVTGLVATARAGGVSDVYIRTDVGGAYVYMRGHAVPRSAQAMGGLQAIRQNPPLMDS
jgi:hypothetical protein